MVKDLEGKDRGGKDRGGKDRGNKPGEKMPVGKGRGVKRPSTVTMDFLQTISNRKCVYPIEKLFLTCSIHVSFVRERFVFELKASIVRNSII